MSGRSPQWRSPYPGVPYGRWICSDGREVLHDREYHPLLERHGLVVRPANPKEWVLGIVEESWFYGDLTAPDRCRATREKLVLILDEFRAGRPLDRFVGYRRRRVA